MRVLIDTPVWSEFFRRERPNQAAADQVDRLIREEQVILAGPVRQEILSGIRDPNRRAMLRDELRLFRNPTLATEDFELAAEYFTRCRQSGVQGSPTDFLLCALSTRLEAQVLTLDRDFVNFAKLLPIHLFAS